MKKNRTDKSVEQLVSAALAGDVGAVRRALAVGANVDSAWDAADGHPPRTALYAAAERGHREMVDELLRAGAKPNRALQGGAQISSMLTALNAAVVIGFPDVARTLLAAGADPRIADERRNTAAHVLMRSYRNYESLPNGQAAFLDLLSCLLDHGVPIDQVAASHTTLVRLALNEDMPLAVLELLLDRKASFTQYDGAGQCAVHWAAALGNIDALRLLCSRGADINAMDFARQTAIWCAADADVARVIIQLGASVDHQDTAGNTCLADLVNTMDPDSDVPVQIPILLEAGASLDIPNFEGSTARMLIRERGLKEVAALASAVAARRAMRAAGTPGLIPASLQASVAHQPKKS